MDPRQASPHTLADLGFPAHAGMDLFHTSHKSPPRRLPRTRGDGPGSGKGFQCRPGASPHTRGWTLRPVSGSHAAQGFPAHAGMDPHPASRGARRPGLPRTRGDGPYSCISAGGPDWASPHTRGWTRIRDRVPACRRGFPAHAGMDPSDAPQSLASTGLPRTRGDGPGPSITTCRPSWASPHTRGWTRTAVQQDTRRDGFPAHAGMDPSARRPARLP